MTYCLQAAAWSAETKDLRMKVVSSGHNTAVQYRELLQIVLHCLQNKSPDSKASLSAVSHKIAECVAQITNSAEQLKGNVTVLGVLEILIGRISQMITGLNVLNVYKRGI